MVIEPAPCYNPESMNISSLLRRLMGIVVLVLALLPLHAQETELFVENVTAEAGGEVAVNVRARGLTNVVGMQFSIAWDTLLLEFQSATELDIPRAMTGFNERELDRGTIGYLAVQDGLEGFSLPDSVALFTINFQSLSPHREVTEISFDSIPLRIRLTDPDNNDVTSGLTSGNVTLEGTNSIPSFAEDARFSAAPNPFSDFVRINTNVAYSGAATLEILDLSGRLVGSRTLSLRSGPHTTELSSRDFPGEGAYIIRLVTDREQLHRKVVLHNRNR